MMYRAIIDYKQCGKKNAEKELLLLNNRGFSRTFISLNSNLYILIKRKNSYLCKSFRVRLTH